MYTCIRILLTCKNTSIHISKICKILTGINAQYRLQTFTCDHSITVVWFYCIYMVEKIHGIEHAQHGVARCIDCINRDRINDTEQPSPVSAPENVARVGCVCLVHG